MARFRVVYFGSNDVPVQLIKPILDGIDAELVIARPKNDADVVESGRDADGIIMHGSVPFTREIIARLKRCRVVCRTGVGVDRMDLQAAAEHGMKVCNAAGCNSIEVAEQTIGLLIAVARKLTRMNQYVREGRWRRHSAELHAYRGPVSRIAGRSLGIVGLGHVRKMFGKAQFAAMKPAAFLINCARGGLVDTDALYDALAAGQIAGAALDVTDPEPLPADHKILTLANVIVTCHTAANSNESYADCQTHAAREVARVLTGQAPTTEVKDPWLLAEAHDQGFGGV
ncbi:MAG: hypothetical protein HYU47_07435 [Deltaproteobacteria bacterium]|nr:hypothetical protein [Deltaproteobacteria bacterium]